MALALSEIKQAAVDAQRAGNIDKAKKLKALYFKAESQMSPGPTAVQPEPQRDSALGYSVDQAQRMFGKGAEAIGRATGIQGVEDFGTRTVAQQDKDIQQGGYQPEYTGSFTDNLAKGTATNFVLEKIQENAASGGFMLGGGLATAATAAVSVPAAYLVGAATMGGGLALGTGEAAFEQEEKLGNYNEVLSVGAGSIIALLDRFGAGKVIPKSKLLSMTTQEITDELNKKGFTRAATAFSKRALAEGGTEALQEGVSMGAATTRGAEYTPKEVRDRFIDAAVLGTTYGAGVQTVTAPINAMTGSSEPTTQAQAAFAQRLDEIARVNNLNLKDINKTSTEGAREAVDKAHVQMTTKLKTLFKALKKQINVNEVDTLEEIEDKVMLEAGYREARTKTKNVVGQQEVDATQRLVGQYGEGQEILNLYGELNEMTKLHNSGYQGGLSATTDQLSPFGSNIGYDRGAIASERILRPIVSGSAAMSTGGASLAGQIAAVGTGRAVDALTGRRSRVRRYVAQNKKGSSFATIPQSAYLHEQERQEKLEEKKRTERLRQEGARLDLPPMPTSPQGMLEEALDMNLASIIPVINDLHNDPNTSPDVRRSARSALNSVANGGRIDDITDLIRHLKKRINPDNTFWRNKAKEVNVVEGRPPEQSRRDAAIQQGIDDNRAFVNELKANLDLENITPIIHKVKLQNALDIALLDLGTNPVLRLDSIRKNLTEDGVPDSLIDRYFNPYIERVNAQQANRRPTPTTPEQGQDESFFLNDDSVEINESRQAPILSLAPGVNMLDVYEGREELPKIKTKAEAGKYLQDRTLEKLNGIPRDLENEVDRDAMADDMVAEAIFEQQSQEEKNALEWYDQTVDKMLSMLSLKYPEINQDEVTRTPILLSLAITSQNLDVPTNLKFAVKVYDHFNKTGKFPIVGTGTSLKVMEGNFKKANILMDRLGPELFTKFLQTEFTVKELNTILTKHLGKKTEIGGELVDTIVYGSAAFGPKVGNGFYTNLRGDFSPVTMDMWFMRTIGRLQGNVLALEEGKFNNQLARLKKALGRKRMSRDALIKKAYELKKKHEKDFKDNRKDYDSGKKVKSEATKAANTIVTSLMTLRDSPVTGTERNQLRDIVTRAVSKYNEQTGMEITPAAFQALIWYPEQDLYQSLGVQLPATRADYASSTKRFLLEDGFNEEDISRAESIRVSEEPGPGSTRQAAVEINESRSGGPGGRTSGTVLQENQSKPALTGPTEQQNLFPPEVEDFRGSTPTNGRIKENLPEAEDIVKGYFDIGKEGGRYENGITDRNDLSRLMTALNVTHVVANSVTDLRKKQKALSGGSDKTITGFATFPYRSGGLDSSVFTLKQGAKDYKGDVISDIENLKTLVHEISHTIEIRAAGNINYDSIIREKLGNRKSRYNVQKPVSTLGLNPRNPKMSIDYTAMVGTDLDGDFSLSNRNANRIITKAVEESGYDTKAINSFRFELNKMLFAPNYNKTKKEQQQRKTMISEIDNLRDSSVTVSAPGIAGVAPLRGESWDTLSEMFNTLAGHEAQWQKVKKTYAKKWSEAVIKSKNRIVQRQIRQTEKQIIGYLWDPAEVAVDPLIFYLMDPKRAKKETPVTANFL